jgi:hypothetical protein
MTRRGQVRAAAGALLLAAGVGAGTVALPQAASANGPCGYLTTDSAYVRETPSINSVVRKTVPAGYPVTGPSPCGPRTGTDGRAWVPVDCGCATDGIGWIIADKLYPLINT